MSTPNCENFKCNIQAALNDKSLQSVLYDFQKSTKANRAEGVKRLPEFDKIRDQAVEIKTHTLNHIDYYLERFEGKVIENGGQVHWAETPDDANKIISDICRGVNAQKVVKGKSMITEEIGLNAHLEAEGFQILETDLGEYIIQLRGETPSHIIAPAVHVPLQGVIDTFKTAHTHLDPDRPLTTPPDLLAEARRVLREHFLTADVGITGANFLIAETGSTVIVTNEGNGDLSQTLPKVHIVVASLEKVVPTLNDAATIQRLLARSVTGQEASVYTTFSTGPKRSQDPDGPEQYHVVLLDNGRSDLIGGKFHDMLRCIRCSACLNHCPVYGAIGGHAYGWVYTGPMGKVISPLLLGIEKAKDHPNISSFCGRCEEVCPMRIPLPNLMRYLREQQFEKRMVSDVSRMGLKTWAFFAKRPALYQRATSLAARAFSLVSGKNGRIASNAMMDKLTGGRDLPAPEGETFQKMWQNRRKDG